MEKRLIDLEFKISHHDIAIEEMQTNLFEQHQRIEKLEKILLSLTDRFKESGGDAISIGPGNDKPPHY